MQAHKPIPGSGHALARTSALPAGAIGDPRELHAHDAARPSVPLARSERLAGPFRVKPGYLERRAWPFSAESAVQPVAQDFRAKV
jgi:hypothetical protein